MGSGKACEQCAAIASFALFKDDHPRLFRHSRRFRVGFPGHDQNLMCHSEGHHNVPNVGQPESEIGALAQCGMMIDNSSEAVVVYNEL